MKRPSWMSRRVWWELRGHEITDHLTGWVACHFLNRHTTRWGTWPKCYRCGKRVR